MAVPIIWRSKAARLEYLVEMRKIICKYGKVLAQSQIAKNSAYFLRQP